MVDSLSQSFLAHAFHPDFKTNKISGMIHCDELGVKFQSVERSVKFPLNGLVVQSGGASDRLIFFHHPQFKEWTLFTSDRRILDLGVFQTEEHAGHIQKIKNQKRWFWAMMMFVFAGFLFLLLSLYLMRFALVDLSVKAIPVAIEEKIGALLVEKMKLSESFLEDQDLKTDFAKLTQPLQNLHAKHHFQFHIVKSPEFNAYALPGGQIVVNSELIVKSESPEEIMAVLAHEMAHVTERHILRQTVSSLGFYVVVQALVGDLGGLTAVLVDNSSFLVNQKFSRDYELEADERGWQYLMQAHVNPKGMIDFFEKLQNEESHLNLGGSIEKALSFVSTHPATVERMTALREKQKQLGEHQKFTKIELDMKKFKDKIENSKNLKETK